MSVIVRVAVPRPLWTLFDYLLPPDVSPPRPGARLRVPFGSSELVGLAVETACIDGVDPELKSVLEVIDQQTGAASRHLRADPVGRRVLPPPSRRCAVLGGTVALRDGRALQPLRRRFWQLEAIDRRRADSLQRAPRQLAAIERLRAAGGIAEHEA